VATKQFVRTIKAERRDTMERLNALRMQAKAWRILAMIALVDTETARKQAQWLLFHTMPWVDGDAVEKYVLDNEARAETCGIEAGVFTANQAVGA
jgi:hypothetical protein